MSNLIVFTVPGDTGMFRKALEERAEEFETIGRAARQQGAIHHQFGIGTNHIQIVDEWEDPEKFFEFFADPALQEFITSIGGDVSQPPVVNVTEATALQSW